MSYESITLKQELIVERIYSIHYFEYMNNFSFPGEAHDFWEFLCVDKGTVNITAGPCTYTLNKHDMIFHQPNEFHSVSANGIVAPNIVVIGFECTAPVMAFFKNRLLQISHAERELLAGIIQEARCAFRKGIEDPYCKKLIRSTPAAFGSEQLIRLYLEHLLISLLRTAAMPGLPPFLPKAIKLRSENELFEQIVTYMQKNLSRQITIDSICSDNLISRSKLQKLFREQAGQGAIDYFCHMKIRTAKQLIRNQQMNFSQIADSLGYNSIHYFSRQFKKLTGMTPSEYASSIQLLSEPPDLNF